MFNPPASATPLAKPLGVQLYTVNAALQADFATTLGGVTRTSFRSAAGNSETTFAGKYEVNKIDESKKLL
jgi:hypothetical protein